MKNSLRKILFIRLCPVFLFAGNIIISAHCAAQSATDVPRQQSSAIMQAGKTSNASDYPTGKMDTQRNDLSGEKLVQWGKYEIVSDTSFRVFFLSGTASCSGYRAIVEETPEEIRVAVVSGLIPEHAPACTLEVGSSHFLLETKNPTAGRKIVPLEHVELKP